VSNTSNLVYVRVAEDARPIPGSLVFSVNVELAPGKFAFVTSNQLYSFRNGNSADAPHAAQRDNRTAAGAAPRPALEEEIDAPSAPTPTAVRPLLLLSPTLPHPPLLGSPYSCSTDVQVLLSPTTQFECLPPSPCTILPFWAAQIISFDLPF